MSLYNIPLPDTDDKQQSGNSKSKPAASSRKKRKAPAPSGTTNRPIKKERSSGASNSSTAAITQSQIADLTPASQAMLRMQRADKHMYGNQYQMLMDWVQLAKKQRLFLANSTLAESAVDLARQGKH